MVKAAAGLCIGLAHHGGEHILQQCWLHMGLTIVQVADLGQADGASAQTQAESVHIICVIPDFSYHMIPCSVRILATGLCAQVASQCHRGLCTVQVMMLFGAMHLQILMRPCSMQLVTSHIAVQGLMSQGSSSSKQVELTLFCSICAGLHKSYALLWTYAL